MISVGSGWDPFGVVDSEFPDVPAVAGDAFGIFSVATGGVTGGVISGGVITGGTGTGGTCVG